MKKNIIKSILLIFLLILIILISYKKINENFFGDPYLDINRIKKIEHPIYGPIYVFDGEDYISNIAKSNMIWEEKIVNELVSNYIDGTDILDIGANIGLNSLRMNQLKKITGTCHLFEPQSDVFLLLDYNTRDISRKIYNIALSDKYKVISYKQNKSNVGATRLNDVSGEIFTSTMPLDSIIFDNKISLIKLDVEGAEYDVIQGARNLLLSHKPTIIIEIWKENLEKVLRLLESLNFKLEKHLGDDDYIFKYKY